MHIHPAGLLIRTQLHHTQFIPRRDVAPTGHAPTPHLGVTRDDASVVEPSHHTGSSATGCHFPWHLRLALRVAAPAAHLARPARAGVVVGRHHGCTAPSPGHLRLLELVIAPTQQDFGVDRTRVVLTGLNAVDCLEGRRDVCLAEFVFTPTFGFE